MKNFNQFITEYQVKWRKKNIQNQDWGSQNNWVREWILPRNDWEEGLWSGIRKSYSNSLDTYLEENRIYKHSGSHNLKSSWVLCANLYYPFRKSLYILTGFLQNKVSQYIEELYRLELEYVDASPNDPSSLLGEPKGQRGKNQTSPDLALKFITRSGEKGLLLVENKFVEHSFYRCSGRKPDVENPDPNRCLNFDLIYQDPSKYCWQMNWSNDDRENRKYWNYIQRTINTNCDEEFKYCPAAIAGYQLFRQQALAEAYAVDKRYELVISCVAYDERNESLIKSLKTTGIEHFKNWRRLFNGKAHFATWTHQEWIEWVRQHDYNNQWTSWLDYVKNRYAIPG